MTLIYALEKNNVPFYIGKTRNPKNRFNCHKRIFNCEILILDEIIDNEWKFWEKYYISLFKSWGFKLENKNNGGGGPTCIKFSEERNKKISESTKGKIISEEHKNKISKANKNHKYNLGRTQSEKTKLLKSFSMKGKKYSKKTKLLKSFSMKGKKHSEITKNKMSKAHKGKPKSKKHIENMMKNRTPVINGVIKANSKPVLQFDLEGNFIKEWSSITEAKKYIKGDIHACCYKKQKTAGGFLWKIK